MLTGLPSGCREHEAMDNQPARAAAPSDKVAQVGSPVISATLLLPIFSAHVLIMTMKQNHYHGDRVIVLYQSFLILL